MSRFRLGPGGAKGPPLRLYRWLNQRGCAVELGAHEPRRRHVASRVDSYTLPRWSDIESSLLETSWRAKVMEHATPRQQKGSRRCPAPRRHTRASRHEQVPFQTIARQGTSDERMPSTGRDSSSDIAVSTPRLTRWWLRR